MFRPGPDANMLHDLDNERICECAGSARGLHFLPLFGIAIMGMVRRAIIVSTMSWALSLPASASTCNLSAIQIGMTKDQVQAACGTPTIADDTLGHHAIVRWIYSDSSRKPPFDIIWFRGGLVHNTMHAAD